MTFCICTCVTGLSTASVAEFLVCDMMLKICVDVGGRSVRKLCSILRRMLLYCHVKHECGVVTWVELPRMNSLIFKWIFFLSGGT